MVLGELQFSLFSPIMASNQKISRAIGGWIGGLQFHATDAPAATPAEAGNSP
jgi:hypothetical protein